MELQDLNGNPLAPEVDQDFARAMSAPVGDATDLKKPAEQKQAPRQSASRPRTTGAKRGPKAAPKASSYSAPPVTPELTATRSEGISGLVQIGAMGCLAYGARTDSVAFKADAVTLANYSKPLGDAVADAAAKNPQFARIVDKITNAGPYAALVGVTFGLGMQLARNHGVTAAESFGAKSPETILAELDDAAI